MKMYVLYHYFVKLVSYLLNRWKNFAFSMQEKISNQDENCITTQQEDVTVLTVQDIIIYALACCLHRSPICNDVNSA